jgi:hypothetical protein
MRVYSKPELWPQFAECDSHDNGWGKYINGTVNISCVPGAHETLCFTSGEGISEIN